MWKNYSAGYFKNNRAMMAFIMTVAFFAGTLISFISHYFYNLFEDYVYRSYLKTGTHEVTVSTAFVIYTVIMILTVISLVLLIYNTAWEFPGRGNGVSDRIYYHRFHRDGQDL